MKGIRYTENISKFVDHHLEPLTRKVNSYIQDTNDFLRKLRGLGNLLDNTIIGSLDVVGLYPSISHDEGLQAIEKAINTREDQSVSTNTLLQLA